MDRLSSRRDFIKIGLGTLLGRYFLRGTGVAHPGLSGKNAFEPKVNLEPFNYAGVRLLGGMLNKQYTATRDFYFKIPDNDILLGFRRRAAQPAPGNELPGWYGHDIYNTFGQWLSGMARMYRATGDVAMREKAARLMLEWGKTIEPDGYFYYSRQPTTPHYSYEKMLGGLVDMYEYAGQREALSYLQKITEWAVKNLDRSRRNPTALDPSSRGTEWYTLSENLYRAYQLTGKTQYKNFGDLWRYRNYWEMFSNQAEPAPHGLHAYSHCNTLSSAAMTYAVSGDPQYLKAIINAYDYFLQTQFYATGGYGPDETLVPPDGSLGRSLETTRQSFETPCGSWAGFKLGRYLMKFTGEARYGDWIEKLVYNGIGAALPMSGRGDTFYYSDYSLGGGHKAYYREASSQDTRAPGYYPCCSGTYIQAVADYHDVVYFKDSTSLYVNLFIPSEVNWNFEGNEIRVIQETSYPASDTTVLTVSPSRTVSFNLKFRVPAWCRGAAVEVNRRRAEIACQPGTWATIRRSWNAGDQVKIRVPMSLTLAAIDKQHSNRVALVYGPVVLVRPHESTLRAPDADPLRWIAPTGRRPLEFRAAAQPTETFLPFYEVGARTSYTMYFDLQH